jgi:hypothetical protein
MPYLTNQYKLNFMKNLLLLFYCSSQRLSPDTFDIMKLPQEHRTHWKLNYTQLLKAILIMDTEDFILSIKRLMLIILWEWRNRFRHVFEKPNGTDPYIIQQGLHNDVVTILRKGLLQQRTYHSTIHFWVCGSHGFRCSFITPTDGKVNGQRSSYPHGTVGTTTWFR